MRRTENVIYCLGMFCPSCAAQNDVSQHYCRACGFKLDVVAAELAVQNPSEEVAALIKKKRLMEWMGTSALSIAGIIGLCLLLALAFYYKLSLLGPQLLFGSAVGALVLFLLASLFFFNYSKFFFKIDALRSHMPERPELSTPTAKLLDDAPFEPASVTEHSTERLPRR